MKDESMQEVTTKQKNKEEGKRRARELAIAKQSRSNTSQSGSSTSTRHGARNQHRHKHFAKWILSTFPRVLEECIDNDTNDTTESQMHILDVAGGKGELSARLCLCHSLHVKMVDPRQADIASVYMKDVVPKLPNKWQGSVHKRLETSPTFVEDLLKKRYEQLVMPFDVPNLESAGDQLDDAQRVDWFGRNMSPRLHEAVQNASLIIGLHADGATEAIVDAALFYNKPFVIVPCCVFPNLFNHRFITVRDTDEAGNSECRRIPVRTHEQFCEYLLNKDERFRSEVLPFEGRNVGIWWDGNA